MAAALSLGACDFNVSGPFEGFDGKGSRVTGSFDSGASAAQGVRAAAASGSFEGLRVTVRERESLSATVGSDGLFTVVGVPSGSFTLVFLRDGRVVGEIRFQSVRSNQEIRIVVSLTSNDEVVLVEEERDSVSFDENECPRGAGFWCQNQGGKNPNLTEGEFEEFATEAAEMLSSVAGLDTPEEVASAVCNTGDQLLRQLASLALNLAAGTLTRDTPLENEPYATVGAAFDAAVAAANGTGSRGDRERIKDVLDRINNNQNHDECESSDDDDDDDGDDDGDDDDPPASGKMTICHIPPGNPAKRHTITIGASAWPAHRAHGDTIGPCS
jgi:hypothetical protein